MKSWDFFHKAYVKKINVEIWKYKNLFLKRIKRMRIIEKKGEMVWRMTVEMADPIGGPKFFRQNFPVVRIDRNCFLNQIFVCFLFIYIVWFFRLIQAGRSWVSKCGTTTRTIARRFSPTASATSPPRPASTRSNASRGDRSADCGNASWRTFWAEDRSCGTLTWSTRPRTDTGSTRSPWERSTSNWASYCGALTNTAWKRSILPLFLLVLFLCIKQYCVNLVFKIRWKLNVIPHFFGIFFFF